MSKSAKYPEHEKINTDKLQAMDELVEWLNSNGYIICKMKLNNYSGQILHAKWQEMRFEFFGAKLKEIEKERREMLKDFRDKN